MELFLKYINQILLVDTGLVKELKFLVSLIMGSLLLGIPIHNIDSKY